MVLVALPLAQSAYLWAGRPARLRCWPGAILFERRRGWCLLRYDFKSAG
jgi:hypothetical protein